MRERALGLQLVRLDIEHGAEDVEIEASFGGLHCGPRPSRIGQVVHVWHAKASGKSLAMAASFALQLDAADRSALEPDVSTCAWSWKTALGQVTCFQRLVAFRHGALYAWEFADTGVETTPMKAVASDRTIISILCGTQEQHISADIAYVVWHYWVATDDQAFLRDAGAEIIIETGRFWVSRAGLETDGLHHIRAMIGPDEYRETIDDNAFTNVMARWNIRRAVDVVAILMERWPERWASLASRLRIDDGEIAGWAEVADAMATGLDADTGLFEQFAGFSALETTDLKAYEGRSVPMDVVLGRERIAKSKVIKQADVVAFMVLLPDEFVGDSGAANFHYYEPLCSHGSSLSRAMHGIAAAKLGAPRRR